MCNDHRACLGGSRVVFFARADCMGAAGQDQLLLLCVCLLFDVSVVHDSSNFKPYRCFPTQKHLKSRYEVGHWIIIIVYIPPRAQKCSMLSCLSRRWFYHMDTAVRYFAFLAWYEALMEVSLHRCFADVPYHSKTLVAGLCLLEIAGFQHGDRYFSTNQLTFHQNHFSYEAARRKCTSSSFSCWGRKRPSWRLGSQVGEVGSKSCRIPTFLQFFVDSMADVKFGHCETTWALWFWKEDMFISFRYSLVDLG